MGMHRRPDPAEPLDLLGGDDTDDLLDPVHLEKLAHDIETRFAEDGN